MVLSILQLNINADNYWSRLIPFLSSCDFDVIQLQEVCGKDSFCGNIQSVRDCYEGINNVLAQKYHSEVAISQRFGSSPTGYMANSTFYKKELQLVEKNIVTLFERKDPFPEDQNHFEDAGRNFIHLKLQKDNQTISFINAHLAWAKTTKEEPHQTQQGEQFIDYLKKLEAPFVITGDFNLDPEQPLIKKVNALARNLIDENKVQSTLNERTHRAKMLFPPGVVVDYIFVSEDVKVNTFEALDKEDLSDHYALTCEIEV